MALTLLYVISIVVYLDLALVNKKKVHVYTPLLKFLPLKSLKTSYTLSLKRDFYCVSDKVPSFFLTFDLDRCQWHYFQ